MAQAGLSQFGSMLGTVLLLAACGGADDDDNGGGGYGDGTVAGPWTAYCTGTFTADTPIPDPFEDEPLFVAKAGAEYLLADFDDTFGGRAEFVYLTAAGPDTFELESSDGSWPFTSNCAIGEGVPYYAVFTNVRVYAEEALTTTICELAAGTALPAGSGSRGYATAGEITLNGPLTYEVYLDAFAEQCGGYDTGYVSVPPTQSFGSNTWLVPLITIIGPD
jgi:hypothetical protein